MHNLGPGNHHREVRTEIEAESSLEEGAAEKRGEKRVVKSDWPAAG